eukprot:GFYU01004664.1.p1 GENE.GFYU01004664.1~~GFYU01004664.1.p1  ORF type:complete len:544 (+),score=136.62 GFYU01004664.1:244-1875(+)
MDMFGGKETKSAPLLYDIPIDDESETVTRSYNVSPTPARGKTLEVGEHEVRPHSLPTSNVPSPSNKSRRNTMSGGVGADTDSNASRAPLTRDNSHAYFYQKMKYYYSLSGGLDSPNREFFRPPAHVIPASVFLWSTRGDRKSSQKQSSFTIIFSIWNTMVGSSLLSIPWGFGQAGLVGGVLLAVGTAFLSYYTCYLILKHGKLYHDFSDMCTEYLGPRSQYVAIFFSCLVLSGALIAYNILMADSLYSVVSGITIWVREADTKSMTSRDTDHGLHYIPAIWTPTTAAIVLGAVLFPLCCLKNMSTILKFNSIGVVCVLYQIFIIVFESVAEDVRPTKIETFDSGFASLGGILMLSFFIHNSILPIMQNMEHPEKKARDLGIAFIVVALSYLIPGVMTAVFFDMRDQGSVQNFLQLFAMTNVVAFSARCATFIQLISVYPLINFIVRTQLFGFLYKSAYPSVSKVLLLNCIIVGGTTLFTIEIPQVGDVLRFTGAICGLVYIFVLPISVHMAILQRKRQLSYQEAALHFGLIGIGLMYLIWQFL